MGGKEPFSYHNPNIEINKSTKPGTPLLILPLSRTLSRNLGGTVPGISMCSENTFLCVPFFFLLATCLPTSHYVCSFLQLVDLSSKPPQA